MYGALADLVVVLHLAFIIFIMFGALLSLVWKYALWLHIPAAMWGAASELFGVPCPLTPLENSLRARAFQEGYSGDFIEHYILPLVYPGNLTPQIQWTLGVALIVFNVALYRFVWKRTHIQGASGGD